MGVCVRLILPDRDEGVQGEILDLIVSKWKGVTVTKGFGLWDGPNGRTTDPVRILECSIPPRQYDDVWWGRLATEAGVMLGEECVFLSTRDERATLVYPDRIEPIRS